MHKRRTTKDLSQARLHNILYYSKLTGLWIWLSKTSPKSNIKIGSNAGYISTDGRRYIGIDGKRYQSSRLAFLYTLGYFPEYEVDHRDRIKSNDIWSNLRESSPKCNIRNRGIAKNNTSGITGVSWDKIREKWFAFIKPHDRTINLGRFKSKVTAVKNRWEAEKKYDFPNCCTTSSAYQYLQGLDLNKEELIKGV